MKKIFAAIIVIALMLSLTSCDFIFDSLLGVLPEDSPIVSLLVDLGLIEKTPEVGDDDVIGDESGDDENGDDENGSTDGDDDGATDGDDDDEENGGNEEEIIVFANVEVQGSNEAINLEFTTAEDYPYSVYYKPAEADDSEYVRLTDDLMVREGDTLKCYIVGISAGTYKVRLCAELGGVVFGITLKDIVVSAQG